MMIVKVDMDNNCISFIGENTFKDIQLKKNIFLYNTLNLIFSECDKMKVIEFEFDYSDSNLTGSIYKKCTFCGVFGCDEPDDICNCCKQWMEEMDDVIFSNQQ